MSYRVGLSACLWLFSAWLACTRGLYAHDPGLSTATIHRVNQGIEIRHGFAPTDALQLVSDCQQSNLNQSVNGIGEISRELNLIAPELWNIRTNSGKVPLASFEVVPVGGDNVEVRLRFAPVSDNVEIEYVRTSVHAFAREPSHLCRSFNR